MIHELMFLNETTNGETMSIPNALPTLSAGAHTPASGKACVMEYVSLLAGEEWSDTPTCTYLPLARVAQVVNDRLSDDNRHLLVPLIGRLFGTTLPVDNRLFALRVARTVEHLSTKAKVRNDVTKAYLAGTAHIEEPLSAGQAFAVDLDAAAINASDAAAYAAYAAYAAAYAAYAAAAAINAAAAAINAAYAAASAADAAAYAADDASDLVAWLESVIDIYDELSGRTEHRDVSDSELAALTLAVRR